VVDDACMQVTHVLRGSEHLNNTPKHIALQKALGLPSPAYAHVPIILNMDGSKMSKRDKDRASARGQAPPEIEVHDFRKAGYLPEAIVNFIALLGWSPGDGREQLSAAELIESFRLERIGRTSARFDRDKLLAFNTDWASRLPPQRLLAGLRDYLAVNGLPAGSAGDDTLLQVLEVCRGFRTFADVARKTAFLFAEDDRIEVQPDAAARVLAASGGAGYQVLEQLLPLLRGLPEWSAAELDALLKARMQEWGLGMGQIAQPLRVAVTGTTISPALQDTLVLLGRSRTLRRIERALACRGVTRLQGTE
jgi:glutamyl/glutaminyl-tRNA synthetase